MSEVVLYHHVQGLTDGVRSFAESCGRRGTPCTRPTSSTGARSTRSRRGWPSRARRGSARSPSAESPPPRRSPRESVYAGFSFGVMPAQQLAQTRPGARGALLMYSCLPVSEFGDAWPEGVPVQVHGKQADPFFAEDMEAAQDLVDSTDRAELFLYPGEEHLFADSSLPAYDAAAAALLTERVVAFLDGLEG